MNQSIFWLKPPRGDQITRNEWSAPCLLKRMWTRIQRVIRCSSGTYCNGSYGQLFMPVRDVQSLDLNLQLICGMWHCQKSWLGPSWSSWMHKNTNTSTCPQQASCCWGFNMLHVQKRLPKAFTLAGGAALVPLEGNSVRCRAYAAFVVCLWWCPLILLGWLFLLANNLQWKSSVPFVAFHQTLISWYSSCLHKKQLKVVSIWMCLP